MGKEYNSVAQNIGEIIDCRCLSLMIEFCDFSFDNSLQFACDVIEWISKIYKNDFIVKRWIMNKEYTNREKALLQLRSVFSSRHMMLYGEEGMAISPIVYNNKTYREYTQNVRWGKYSSFQGSQYVSADFLDYWNHTFSENEIGVEQIKQRVLHIFREEDKRHLSYFQFPDIQSILKILPLSNCPSRFYGTYSVSFSACCLASGLDEAAEYLANLAEYLSITYQNMNARVMLQPMVGLERNPYMMVFGQNGNLDESHIEANCLPQEWYPTYYVPGAEWFNILSPVASAHLFLSTQQTSNLISQRETSGGSRIIRSNKSIIQYDISDGLETKRILSPALYPGGSYIKLKSILGPQCSVEPLISFPRSNWAIIPVFENEIKVSGEYLVFSANKQE